MTKVNNLGIDTTVKGAVTLMKLLRRLKTTNSCRLGGTYNEDNTLCQIHIETTKTEKALDNWLCNSKHECTQGYIGVFVRSED